MSKYIRRQIKNKRKYKVVYSKMGFHKHSLGSKKGKDLDKLSDRSVQWGDKLILIGNSTEHSNCYIVRIPNTDVTFHINKNFVVNNLEELNV